MAGAHAGIADDITSNIKWKYRDKGSMIETTMPGTEIDYIMSLEAN